MRKFGIVSLPIAFLAVLAASPTAGQEQGSLGTNSIPEKKQTARGLYVTSAEAYSMWLASPEKVNIVDVRTPEEFLFVGHAEMAWNIPVAVQEHEWDANKRYLTMSPNAAFVAQVKELFTVDDTLLVMCRSGSRSAKAVDKLTEAGFKNAYSVIDGMEGDMVKDPGSAFHGKRMKNGWKNSGLPWTYEIDAQRMLLPESR